jgi:hypothetical protein
LSRSDHQGRARGVSPWPGNGASHVPPAQAGRNYAGEILAAVAASVCFGGFLGAIHAALTKLSH